MNPFIYDSEVTGSKFCGRKDAIKYLSTAIKNSSNVILYSRRRMGKTSLIKEVVQNHTAINVIPVLVDIYPVSSIRDIYTRFENSIKEALMPKNTTLDKIATMIEEMQEYFTSSKVTVEIGLSPQLKIESTEKDYFKALEALLLNFFDYTKEKQKKVVFSIDEFQKIASLKERDSIEELLRTVFKEQKHCAFIFTGSKQHMLKTMFTEESRPLYKIGDMYDLAPIDMNTFYGWAQDHMMQNDIFIEEAAFELLYNEAEKESRFIQLILHKIYNLGSGERYKTTAIKELIAKTASNMSHYAVRFDEEYSQSQQNALKLLAACGGVNIYDKYLLDEFFIEKPSLQSAVRSFLKKGNLIIKEQGRYMFLDVEFKLWLKQNI